MNFVITYRSWDLATPKILEKAILVSLSELFTPKFNRNHLCQGVMKYKISWSSVNKFVTLATKFSSRTYRQKDIFLVKSCLGQPKTYNFLKDWKSKIFTKATFPSIYIKKKVKITTDIPQCVKNLLYVPVKDVECYVHRFQQGIRRSELQ